MSEEPLGFRHLWDPRWVLCHGKERRLCPGISNSGLWLLVSGQSLLPWEALKEGAGLGESLLSQISWVGAHPPRTRQQDTYCPRNQGM